MTFLLLFLLLQFFLMVIFPMFFHLLQWNKFEITIVTRNVLNPFMILNVCIETHEIIIDSMAVLAFKFQLKMFGNVGSKFILEILCFKFRFIYFSTFYLMSRKLFLKFAFVLEFLDLLKVVPNINSFRNIDVDINIALKFALGSFFLIESFKLTNHWSNLTHRFFV